MSRDSIDAMSDDPRPEPPREPALGECCKGGCDPCVFDRYYEALESYREELRLWQLRHPKSATGKVED